MPRGKLWQWVFTAKAQFQALNSPGRWKTLAPLSVTLSKIFSQSRLIVAVAGSNIPYLFVGFDLVTNIFFQYIARDVHQGITIINIDAHAGQAREVVVQHPSFLLGIIR
jgi:hypothetical protein